MKISNTTIIKLNIFLAGIVLFSLLLISKVKCEEKLIINYGVGFRNIPQTKVFDLEYVKPLFPNISVNQKFEGGFWINPGHSSAFGFYSWGIAPKFGVLTLFNYWGVGAISNPSKYLSGNMQFTNDTGIRFTDDKGTSYSIKYKHISNAGMKLPNSGRDFIMLGIGFSF